MRLSITLVMATGEEAPGSDRTLALFFNIDRTLPDRAIGLRPSLTGVLRGFPGTFADHKRCIVAVHCQLARLFGPDKKREGLAEFSDYGAGA